MIDDLTRDFDDSYARAIARHPLVLTPDGAILSKSAHATGVRHLRRMGRSAATVIEMETEALHPGRFSSI